MNFWDPILIDQVVQDEFGYLLTSGESKRDGLYPLGEILGSSDNEFMPIGGCRLDFTNEIESPL